eukprot:2277789-Prorocentrum_lima.AAC.1
MPPSQQFLSAMECTTFCGPRCGGQAWGHTRQSGAVAWGAYGVPQVWACVQGIARTFLGPLWVAITRIWVGVVDTGNVMLWACIVQ